MRRQDGEGHQHLIGVKPGIAASQILDLGLLDGLNHALRDELHLMVDAGQMFGHIEQEGGATAEQRT